MSALSDERLREIAAQHGEPWFDTREYVALATELFALRAELAGVRAGTHRIVPVEPTEVAVCAGDEAICALLNDMDAFLKYVKGEAQSPAAECYRAMLAATGGTDG